jgi:hypothetical protein
MLNSVELSQTASGDECKERKAIALSFLKLFRSSRSYLKARPSKLLNINVEGVQAFLPSELREIAAAAPVELLRSI